jgi:hypothetical protein
MINILVILAVGIYILAAYGMYKQIYSDPDLLAKLYEMSETGEKVLVFTLCSLWPAVVIFGLLAEGLRK